MRPYPLILALVCSSMLAACGGGGDDTNTAGDGAGENASQASGGDVADKYAGTWTACTANGTTSFKTETVNTKTSASSVSYSMTTTLYLDSASCTGSASLEYSESGSVVYQGTKVVGDYTVDKGEANITHDSKADTDEPRTKKDISLVVNGNTAYLGDDTSVDAEGYPTALNFRVTLNKR